MTEKKTAPYIYDANVAFDEDTSDNGLIIRNQQHIPDEHIAQLKRDKIDTMHTPTGDFYRVASIPVSVHEQWLREGYDCTREPIRSTLKRLRAQHLDAFITTNKRI